MNKSKLAFIIDSLFCALALFMILFVWIRRITKSAILSLFFSISISLFAFIVILYLSLKKHSKQNHAFHNKKFNDECINFLIYAPLKTYINFIENLLSTSHINGYIFKTDNFYFYVNLKYEPTDKDFQNLIETINQSHNKNFKIFSITKSTSKSFDELVSNSPFHIFSIPISTLQKVMELKNLYPIENKIATVFIPLFRHF